MTTVTLFFVHVNNVNMLWQKIYHKILLTHPGHMDKGQIRWAYISGDLLGGKNFNLLSVKLIPE